MRKDHQLYLFYSTDLLDIPGTRGQSLGVIDDKAYRVQGLSCGCSQLNGPIKTWSTAYVLVPDAFAG